MPFSLVRPVHASQRLPLLDIHKPSAGNNTIPVQGLLGSK